MWFPYSLPAQWKAESEQSRVNEALADESARQFLVGFYLHSRLTHEWDVDIQLKEPYWVTGSGQAAAFSIGYFPNEAGNLAEIICRIEESSPAVALRRCHERVTRVLGWWSATKGRSFGILGFRVADLRYDVRWRALPHRPSAEAFEPPACDVLPESYWPVMALYREARNSSSDLYRLLCCHKVLRLWGEGAAPFHRMTEEREMQDLVVSQEMLALSGLMEFRPELEGVGLGALPAAIAPWRDWAEDALVGAAPAPAIDDYEQRRKLAAVANLLDLAAHHTLRAEIEHWRQRANGDRGPEA